MKRHLLSLLVLVFLASGGCAHVPKESAVLSQELTGMINAARSAHLSLVEGYVDERRTRVDDFMREKWIPDFLGRFVNESDVLAMIEKTGPVSEKGKIMLQFAEAATKEIYARRDFQMDALDGIERAMKDEVSAHYADMLAVNQAITAHLMSAAEVGEARDELLEQLKISGKEILPVDKINEILEKIVSHEGKLDDLPGYVDEARKLIRKEM